MARVAVPCDQIADGLLPSTLKGKEEQGVGSIFHQSLSVKTPDPLFRPRPEANPLVSYGLGTQRT